MSDRLFIFDTTLRDGEQVPGCQLNTVEKIQVAKQLETLGVDVIEAGFPISSPGDFNSVIEISKAVTWPTICALTRAVEHDIDVAVEALQYAKHKRIHTGIGTSESHIKYKFNATREEIIDRAYEAAKGKNKVGTTGKGIGPTYSEKASRTGLRVGDILDNFEIKYQTLKRRHEHTLRDLGYTDYDITEEEQRWLEGVDYMRQFPITDTEIEINRLLSEGKNVLAEGAQGTMLDIDHGTYPFVSSSNTTTGGVCTGLGVGPNKIREVYGIFKAYSTRVGAGPFPVELFDETGDRLREIGHEYGAVTGRNRRCGWVDLVALKYAIMINGVTQLIMMKSDVLDGFPTIRACVAYEKDGVQVTDMPFDTEGWTAVYRDLPGWSEDLSTMTSEAQFPQAFKDYIHFLETELQTPITILSVGPDRAQTIIRK